VNLKKNAFTAINPNISQMSTFSRQDSVGMTPDIYSRPVFVVTAITDFLGLRAPFSVGR
jgi:hypothetical protein